MDNFAPKKVFYDTAMNDTLYHSNDLSENSISFSERFNNYLKAKEQGGIVKDVQIKPLINKQVMDTEGYGFTQGFTVTAKHQKSKFKTGDKVKIIKDYIMDIKRESVNFKGFEGVVNDVIFNSFTFEYDYTIAVNGITTSKINESALELIE